ncbi:MAG: hypothetical protein ACKO4A_17115, partial [Gammaproteobacteria bacterium]
GARAALGDELPRGALPRWGARFALAATLVLSTSVLWMHESTRLAQKPASEPPVSDGSMPDAASATPGVERSMKEIVASQPLEVASPPADARVDGIARAEAIAPAASMAAPAAAMPASASDLPAAQAAPPATPVSPTESKAQPGMRHMARNAESTVRSEHAPGDAVSGITARADAARAASLPTPEWIEGEVLVGFEFLRDPNDPHRWTLRADTSTGSTAARLGERLRAAGFTPGVACPGASWSGSRGGWRVELRVSMPSVEVWLAPVEAPCIPEATTRTP